MNNNAVSIVIAAVAIVAVMMTIVMTIYLIFRDDKETGGKWNGQKYCRLCGTELVQETRPGRGDQYNPYTGEALPSHTRFYAACPRLGTGEGGYNHDWWLVKDWVHIPGGLGGS
jgi:hypothetical protein